MKVVTHEGIYNYKMYDGNDDEAFIAYYHDETRRKCRTTITGVLLLLNWTPLPFHVKISIRMF